MGEQIVAYGADAAFGGLLTALLAVVLSASRQLSTRIRVPA